MLKAEAAVVDVEIVIQCASDDCLGVDQGQPPLAP